MDQPLYYAPHGGLSPQTALLTDRAVFTTSYAVIPKGVFSDITTSFLPGWDKTRLWVIARPLSGFAETFAHYVMEVSPGGGSRSPEPDKDAEGVIFITEGELQLTHESSGYRLSPGSYAYVPASTQWYASNAGDSPCRFHWIRKRYQAVQGLAKPDFLTRSEKDVVPAVMPDTNGAWSTTRFVSLDDLRHDMHVTIVNFEPGGLIPFAETHVMEHGLYILEGKAVYRLNQDWVEVQAGDYLWLRAFCPQACYAGGPGRFRYLLYKDVNRHMQLTL